MALALGFEGLPGVASPLCGSAAAPIWASEFSEGSRVVYTPADTVEGCARVVERAWCVLALWRARAAPEPLSKPHRGPWPEAGAG